MVRGAFIDSLNHAVVRKLVRFEITEAMEDLEKCFEEHKRIFAAFGVVVGAGVLWRWVRQWQRKKHLAHLRELKRHERQQAFEQLELQIKNSKMTREEVDRIVKLSITDLLEQIKNKSLTASQVLTAYQIKALEVHKQTNCLVEPILEAQKWAEELDRGEYKGPLHGLPVSLKDCLGIQGYDMTIGCSKFIGQPCAEDSVLVKVLKQQGAIPFVKTNIPQTMLSWHSTNPIFGLTTNPFDPKRTAGGSSGGEGALIASGGSLLGIGTDVGGSIRIPGALCGIPAFKPTSARISRKGGRAIIVGKNIQSSFGPMARDVEGLILLMRSVLVPQMYELDPILPLVPFREEPLQDKRPLRIGYSYYNGAFEVVPSVRRAVEEAKSLLQSAGHQLIAWDPDLLRLYELLISCAIADGFKELGDLLTDDALDDAIGPVKRITDLPGFVKKFAAFVLKPFNPELSEGIRSYSGFSTVSELWEAIKEVKTLQSSVIDKWQALELDAFICPVFGCPAVSNELTTQLPGVATYTAPFNVLDFPAGSVPITRVTERDEAATEFYPSMTKPNKTHRLLKKDTKGTTGLPVSVQVVALPWQDELCLKVMSDLEKAVKH